jgi:hypothetical protein
MSTTSKWHACFWLISLLVVTLIACKDNTPPPSYKLQHEISKVIESHYFSGPQPVGRSTKPPIIYQGKTYYCAIGVERTYRYDIQGRLIFKGQTQMNVDRPNDLYGKEYNTYTYLGNRIIRYSSNQDGYDTLTINSRGYAIPDFFLRHKAIYEYDKENHLIRKLTSYEGFDELTSRLILDGNVRKEVIENKYTTTTTELQYDLAHSAFTNPLALFNEGKGNLNLVVQSVTQYTRPDPSSNYGTTYPYTISINYTYEFDDLNRVTQQTIIETNTNKATPGIIVSQFIYSN